MQDVSLINIYHEIVDGTIEDEYAGVGLKRVQVDITGVVANRVEVAVCSPIWITSLPLVVWNDRAYGIHCPDMPDMMKKAFMVMVSYLGVKFPGGNLDFTNKCKMTIGDDPSVIETLILKRIFQSPFKIEGVTPGKMKLGEWVE